jgi:hypothetical protein
MSDKNMSSDREDRKDKMELVLNTVNEIYRQFLIEMLETCNRTQVPIFPAWGYLIGKFLTEFITFNLKVRGNSPETKEEINKFIYGLIEPCTNDAENKLKVISELENHPVLGPMFEKAAAIVVQEPSKVTQAVQDEFHVDLNSIPDRFIVKD